MSKKSLKKLKKSVDKQKSVRYINKAVAKNGDANYEKRSEKI